jgi:prevent-host-death family protein
MPVIGVRELRERTSKVIRQVREERAEYVVTHQGRPVAIILPLDTERAEAEMVQATKKTALSSWEAYERLAQEIRGAWPEDVSSQELIDAIRR